MCQLMPTLCLKEALLHALTQLMVMLKSQKSNGVTQQTLASLHQFLDLPEPKLLSQPIWHVRLLGRHLHVVLL